MCTVKLGRKYLPGFKTYSLGSLCKELGISITDRHRASGDALATVKLFELILAQKALRDAKHDRSQLRLF
jgi:DNA polymerase-3 subunit epsilon